MVKETYPVVDLQFGGTAQYMAYVAAQQAGYASCLAQQWSSDEDRLDLSFSELIWEDIRPDNNDHDIVMKTADCVVSICRNRRDYRCLVYSVSAQVAADEMERLRKLIIPATRQPKLLDVTFWYWTQNGPRRYDRQLQAPGWNDIAQNYPTNTREKLERLQKVDLSEGTGKLILWQGEPGTGKTFALRALGEEWASWCRIHYVLDPENFFGEGDYLLSVILEDGAGSLISADEKRPAYRLIVLEDAGEMLAKDAKRQVGQGLARLLNLCDGLLGQGLRVLVLITTNEQVGTLHTAVSRPGRCLSQIVFDRFDAPGANRWLREHGYEDSVGGPRALADLYALTSGAEIPERQAAGFKG
jgi:hypothetical protein